MHVANAQDEHEIHGVYILEYVNEKLVAGRRQSKSGRRELNLGRIGRRGDVGYHVPGRSLP